MNKGTSETIASLLPQWRGHRGYEGQVSPHFCHDCAWDFPKIDEEIGRGGDSSKFIARF